jgi:hypothetical protein
MSEQKIKDYAVNQWRGGMDGENCVLLLQVNVPLHVTNSGTVAFGNQTNHTSPDLNP